MGKLLSYVGRLFRQQCCLRLGGASLVEKFYSMVACEKEVILGAQNLMSDLLVADQKPFVASVCQLNDGKTMADAMQFSKQLIGMADKAAGASVGGTMFTPCIRDFGFDYVTAYYGETSEMTKLMNGVRDRSMPAAMVKAGLQPQRIALTICIRRI